VLWQLIAEVQRSKPSIATNAFDHFALGNRNRPNPNTVLAF
jgi:hypothetical protein